MVSRPRVLIADDNRTNQMIISRLLLSAGFDSVAVSCADDILDEVRKGLPFDAVVLDVFMPGMSGADAVSVIRYEEKHHAKPRHVPVVIVTADGSAAVRDECMQAGADAFLTHPIGAGTLAVTLNSLIRSKTLRSSMPDDSTPLAVDELETLLMSISATDLISAWKADSTASLGYLQLAIACGDIEAFREQFWTLCSASLSFGGTNIRAIYEMARDFQPQFFSSTGPVIFEVLLYEVGRLTEALEQFTGTKDAA
jgi:two-component system sensor histidine kinase RpfC